MRCPLCCLLASLCPVWIRTAARESRRGYLGWSAATRQCSGRDQRSVSLAHSPMLRLSGSTSMVMPWLRVGSFWMARSVSQFAFASGWVPSSTRAKTVWSCAYSTGIPQEGLIEGYRLEHFQRHSKRNLMEIKRHSR